MHGRIFRCFHRRTAADPPRGGSVRSACRGRTLLRAAPAFAIATAHIGVAAWLGQNALQREASVPLQATATLVFACLATWFGVIAYRSAYAHQAATYVAPIRQRAYWRWCGATFVASYALALVVGSHPSAAYVFWISVAVSHAAIWSLVSGPPDRPGRVADIFQRRALRVAACALYLLFMVPLAGEVGLRVYALAVDESPLTRYVTDLLKLPAGGERLGQRINSQGYWDEEFSVTSVESRLRIAALGDESVLCGDAESNFLAQCERLTPGVEVLNFGLPQASPREYAAQLKDAVAPCRPDVLLVCISVASDVTDAPPLPGPFDWRSLHLVQRSMNSSLLPLECGDNIYGCTPDGAQRTAFLDEAVQQLEVCRVPVHDSLQERWRAVFDHIDGILRRCRDADIEPTLVVLPCQFQVDERLLQTLRRRAGYRSDQIDIDLPQRRLSAYAKDRRVQLLDLMPHLRASRAPTYCCDVAHFNEHGNTLAATILSEWLESEYGSMLLTAGP